MIQKKKKKKKQRENECFFDDDASKERSATTRTPQTNWRTSSFIDEMMRKDDLCDKQSQRVSLERFFLTVTVECGVLISSLEHFFLSDCFWQFFLFRARKLFSPLKQIALVSSFRSFLASGKSFSFFLSKIINSGLCRRTTTRSDECAQRKAVAYHRLIDFALFVCACVRERVREQRVHDLIQLF